MRTAHPFPGYGPDAQGAGLIDPHAAWQSVRVQSNAMAPSASASKARAAALAAKPAYVPDQVMVKIAPGASLRAVTGMAAAAGLQVMKRFDVPDEVSRKLGGDLYLLRVGSEFVLQPGDDPVEKAIERLSGRPGVLYAEPNYRISLGDETVTAVTSTPTPHGSRAAVTEPPPFAAERRPSDLAKEQWDMLNQGQTGGKPGVDIGATRAWALQTGRPGGQGPVIAVIDSGVDYTHPDLAANMWTNPNEKPGNGEDDDFNGFIDDAHGINAAKRTGDPMDDNGHGTHCAGVIGAVANNGTGIAGLNWNATIAGVKMSNEFGQADAAAAVTSILYATSIGARITSNSWGAAGYSQALRDAMAASPALHVCAAGNSAQNNDVYPTYPASFNLSNVIAVAAHNQYDEMPHFSNYGAASVHVAAPGEAILSTIPGGRYGQMSGTSMATPHVAGVAGLIVSQFPDITNEQIVTRLMASVVKAPAYADKTISGGRVDAAAALRTDAIAPGQPRELRASQVGASRVTLEWLEGGDDGGRGQAWRYEVRVSDSPISDERTWQQAWVAASEAPKPAGSREAVSIRLAPEKQAKARWFGVRLIDHMGNVSPIAVTSATTPAARVVFDDDFESDSGSWLLQGGWGRVTVGGRGQVLTDSPGGAYPADANTWAASRPIDLRGCRRPVLKLSEKHDFEANADFCRVEITADGGRTWCELACYTGTEDWQTRTVDLSAFEGQTVQVRFHVTSDGAFQKDGVYIDNVSISGDA